MPFSLPNVIDILDYRRVASGLMGKLLSARLENMREKLISALSLLENQKLNDFHEIYGSLDAMHQARILLSAELGEVLKSADSVSDYISRQIFAEKVVNIVTREHAIYEHQCGRLSEYLRLTLSNDIYSPMGDRHLKRHSGGWVPQQQYLIDNYIAIDFDSPIAMGLESSSGVLSAQGLKHTNAEKNLVKEKISIALMNIDAAAPIAGQLVRNFVRRIVVRKSVESSHPFRVVQSAPFNSEYQPNQPGSLRMLNIHHPQKTIVGCMESIYHESIHSVLSSWEALNGHFAPSDVNVRPISPWTGNPIPNHSFAHAVFVWYGLHRLFEGCIFSEAKLEKCGRGELQNRLALFASGFLLHVPLKEYFTHNEMIHVQLHESIGLMQDNIYSFYRSVRGVL